MLVVAQDARAANRLRSMLSEIPDDLPGEPTFVGYPGLAQRLIRRFWPLVAEKYQVLSTTPEFLLFDLTQYACLLEYRKDPGALQRLTMREQRVVIQIIDNMNLAASNGLAIEDLWERIAAGSGVEPDYDVFHDGMELTRRFRDHCASAGVMAFDLQIEAANWLLDQEIVRQDLLRRYDTLALDALDEFVPSMARSLTDLAPDFEEAIVTYSPDGGVRWVLGASAEQAGIAISESLTADRGFKRLTLARGVSPAPINRNGSAVWLSRSMFHDFGRQEASPSAEGWLLTVSGKPLEMAEEAARTAAALVEEGVPGADIAIIVPYIEPLVAEEIERLLSASGIPILIERRQQALYDDPLSRVCLTAVRATDTGSLRAPGMVEIAELLSFLQGINLVDAHRLAPQIYDPLQLRFRVADSTRDRLPATVSRLLNWAEQAGNKRVDEILEAFAFEVLNQSAAPRRHDLIVACHQLIQQATDFLRVAPRFGLAEPFIDSFFDYIDSYVRVSHPVDAIDPATVLLTTAYAFLTAGRSVQYQLWLDVGSPAWLGPRVTALSALHLLNEPQASPDQGFAGFTTSRGDDRSAATRRRIAEPRLMNSYDIEERRRDEITGRLIRNLAARCDGGVFAFASRTTIDGGPLDTSPLLDGFESLGITQR